METINMKEFRREARKQKIKNWIDEKKFRAGEIWRDNKEEIVVLAPIAAGIIGKTIKVTNKHRRDRLDRNHRNLDIYDPQLRNFVRLRRELTTAEYLELERRRMDGEPIRHILYDMRVI